MHIPNYFYPNAVKTILPEGQEKGIGYYLQCANTQLMFLTMRLVEFIRHFKLMPPLRNQIGLPRLWINKALKDGNYRILLLPDHRPMEIEHKEWNLTTPRWYRLALERLFLEC